MRTLNLFIRAVLQEAPELDPDAVDIISVQSGGVPKLEPAVDEMYTAANQKLFSGLPQIAQDVSAVLEQHDEVGIRWSRDDYVFLAQGVAALLKKDAADSSYYPYRTALFVISYRQGITSPMGAVKDAVSYTDTFIKQIKAYSPISYTSRAPTDADKEDSIAQYAEKYGVSLAVAAAILGSGAVAAKMLKKAGVEVGAKKAAAAAAASPVGLGAAQGAIRGVLADPVRTTAIADAIFDAQTAQSAAQGAGQSVSAILRGVDLSAAAAAVRQLDTALAAAVSGPVPTSLAAFRTALPALAGAAIDAGVRDQAGAAAWLLKTAGEQGGLSVALPKAALTALGVEEAAFRALSAAMVQGPPARGAPPRAPGPLRDATSRVFGIFFDALRAQTLLGRAGRAVKGVALGVPLVALAAGSAGTVIAAGVDLLGLDANDTTEVPDGVARVIGTDVRIRGAASDAIGWMTRQPGYGELGVRGSLPLEIGGEMTALEDLLQTPCAQDVSPAEMRAVGAAFTAALVAADETDTLQETLHYHNTRAR